MSCESPCRACVIILTPVISELTKPATPADYNIMPPAVCCGPACLVLLAVTGPLADLPLRARPQAQVAKRHRVGKMQINVIFDLT